MTTLDISRICAIVLALLYAVALYRRFQQRRRWNAHTAQALALVATASPDCPHCRGVHAGPEDCKAWSL